MKTIGDLMKLGLPFIIDYWVYYPISADAVHFEDLNGEYSFEDNIVLDILLKEFKDVDWFEDCNTKERWEILQEKCCCPIISLGIVHTEDCHEK